MSPSISCRRLFAAQKWPADGAYAWSCARMPAIWGVRIAKRSPRAARRRILPSRNDLSADESMRFTIV